MRAARTRSDARVHFDEGPAPGTSAQLPFASALSLLAGGIHAGIAGEHLALWWVYGVFFLVVAAAQAICGVLLAWHATSPVLFLGLWGNVTVIGVYVWSRVSGFVPPAAEAAEPAHLGGPETVGLLDLTALLAELALVAVLVTRLDARWRRGTTNALFALALLAVGLRLSGSL